MEVWEGVSGFPVEDSLETSDMVKKLMNMGEEEEDRGQRKVFFFALIPSRLNENGRVISLLLITNLYCITANYNIITGYKIRKNIS